MDSSHPAGQHVGIQLGERMQLVIGDGEAWIADQGRPGTISAFMEAALAASRPVKLSSMARQCTGSTPSFSAAWI